MKEQDKTKVLLLSLLMVSICLNYVLSITNIQINHHKEHFLCEDYCSERFGDYNIPQGYYHPDQFFCVKTYDRSINDIIKTTSHELAHVFVHRDNKHFCEIYDEEINFEEAER